MKAKISRGGGFRGALNYVLDEGKKRTGDKKSLIVAGNMSGSDAKTLSREFSFSRSLRSDIKNPVWHCSLSLPKGDSIDVATWDRLSNRFLQEMGVDTGNHQFIVVKHHDTDKEHVHIVMSRISLDSQLWHGRNDVMHAIEATQILEKEFGLTLTPGYFELNEKSNKVKRKISKKDPKPKETQMAARTGEAPKRLLLQQIIDEATKGKTDVFSFIERLECAGVTVRPNVAKTGRLNGFSFEYQGIPFKGSDLGDDYKWSKDSKLKQNVLYEQIRDSEKLIAEAERIKQETDKRSEAVTANEAKWIESDNRHNDTNRSRPDVIKSAAQSDSKKSRAIESRSSERISVRSGSPNISNEQANEINNGSVQQIESCDRKPPFNRTKDRLKREARDVRCRFAVWDVVNSTVSDLAAPFNSNTGTGKQSPDQLKKIKAWRSQHEALNAEKYRITLVPRKDGAKPWVVGKKGDSETFYNDQQVERMIPMMRQKNAQGYDIYITPIDDNYHFVVVDDLTEQQHMALMKDGFKPNLVQESSKDNRQAIFKVAKQGEQAEQQAANAVVVELNREYGDKNFSGVVHPFRLAGFSNKKEGRNNAFTRILARSKDACFKISEMLKNKLEIVRHQRIEQAIENRVSDMSDYLQFSTDAESQFKRNWSKVHALANKKNWVIDYSRIDFQAAKLTLKDGVKPDDLVQAIIEHSPGVINRKSNPDDYAKRTVIAAQNNLKLEFKPDFKQESKRRPKRDKYGTIIGWLD
ncbi:TPA: relaxase/mobilization nuclease domain-containing protein [Photobacterium damselae]